MGVVENIIQNAQQFTKRFAEQNGISEYVTVRDDGKKVVAKTSEQTQQTLHTGLSDDAMSIMFKSHEDLSEREKSIREQICTEEFATTLAVLGIQKNPVLNNSMPADREMLSELSRKFVQSGRTCCEDDINVATKILNEDYAENLRTQLAQQVIDKRSVLESLGDDADWSDSRNRQYYMEVYDLENQFRAVDKYYFENFECNELTGKEFEFRQTMVGAYKDNNPYEFIGCNEVYGKNNEFVGFCEPRLYCAEDASFNPVTMDNIIRPSTSVKTLQQTNERNKARLEDYKTSDGASSQQNVSNGVETTSSDSQSKILNGTNSLRDRFNKVTALNDTAYDPSKNTTFNYN